MPHTILHSTKMSTLNYIALFSPIFFPRPSSPPSPFFISLFHPHSTSFFIFILPVLLPLPISPASPVSSSLDIPPLNRLDKICHSKLFPHLNNHPPQAIRLCLRFSRSKSPHCILIFNLCYVKLISSGQSLSVRA